MKLIDLFQIEILDEKINGYLLSLSHAIGKHKARYFSNHGFTAENAAFFKESIIELVKSVDINKQISHNYGINYVIEGEMKTPLQTKIRVKTVWVVLTNQNIATLVTIYPLK